MSGAGRVISVRLHGGLGNQLFQYAAALGFAGDHDASSVEVMVSEAERERLIDIVGPDPFLDRAVEPFSGDAASVLGRTTPMIGRVRRQLVERVGRSVVIRQSAHQVFSASGPKQIRAGTRKVRLDGYFQHPTFFGVAAEQLSRRIATNVSEVAHLQVGADTTVIAIRRGDYVRLGWDLPLRYYMNALNLVHVRGRPCWVIGDDDAFVDLMIERLDARGVAAARPPRFSQDPLKTDLGALIAADNVVMANSTFCWWGVSAGDTADRGRARRVIAPEPWIGGYLECELVRPGWETMAWKP